jgi:hypothetical protein
MLDTWMRVLIWIINFIQRNFAVQFCNSFLNLLSNRMTFSYGIDFNVDDVHLFFLGKPSVSSKFHSGKLNTKSREKNEQKIVSLNFN